MVWSCVRVFSHCRPIPTGRLLTCMPPGANNVTGWRIDTEATDGVSLISCPLFITWSAYTYWPEYDALNVVSIYRWLFTGPATTCRLSVEELGRASCRERVCQYV